MLKIGDNWKREKKTRRMTIKEQKTKLLLKVFELATYESEFCSWVQLNMVDGSFRCYTMIVVRQRALLSPYDIVR